MEVAGTEILPGAVYGHQIFSNTLAQIHLVFSVCIKPPNIPKKQSQQS